MSKADQIYVQGRWAPSASNRRAPVVNPATEELIGEVTLGDSADVEAAVQAARLAQPGWAITPVGERLELLAAMGREIEARADEMALTITSEMGAPLGFSRAAQVGLPLRNLAVTLEAMAGVEDERLGTSLVRREPIGVAGAITPWNFPLHQIIAKIAPAMAAGCAVVLKPSEITPLDAVLLTEAIAEAGIPAGVFNLVQGGAEAGAALAGHPGLDIISFTGSTRGGRAVAAAAAQNLTKAALELGGKSANILLDDADFARAVPAALGQCFINSGQICAALSRLLVPSHRLAEVEEMAAEAVKGWTVGDPLNPANRLGPLASRAQQARVRGFIDGAVSGGARLIAGGSAMPPGLNRGAYVRPTILAGVGTDTTVACEETFGPVLLIMTYEDEDDAVRIANATDYGLSGGIWSCDDARALGIAGRLRTGQVILNGANLDVAAPFGGVKQSGYGREYGRYGLEEFFSLKAVLGVAVEGGSGQ